MIRLIGLETRKLANSRTYMGILLLYLFAMTLTLVFAESVLNLILLEVGKRVALQFPEFNLYSFPLIWHNLTYIGSIFNLFPAIIIILLVTDEMGHGRVTFTFTDEKESKAYLVGKLLLAALLCILGALMVLITGLFLGWAGTEEFTQREVFQKIEFVPAFFLEQFTFCMIALIFAVVFDRSALALSALVLYYYMFEPLIAIALPGAVSGFLPAHTIANLISTPNAPIFNVFNVKFIDHVSAKDMVMCIVYSVLFALVVYLILNYRNPRSK